jgi:hypothetical protein
MSLNHGRESFVKKRDHIRANVNRSFGLLVPR